MNKAQERKQKRANLKQSLSNKEQLKILKMQYTETYSKFQKLFEDNFMHVCEGDKKDRQKMGQFFTPFPLAWKMADKFGKKALKNPTKTCLDPTCGYGNLLIVLMMRKISLGADPTLTFVNTYGNELDPEVLKICKKNIRKFAKLFDIHDTITDYVIDTHYHVGNALESSAYEFTISEVKYLMKHKDELGVIMADGATVGIMVK